MPAGRSFPMIVAAFFATVLAAFGTKRVIRFRHRCYGGFE
jgi:hypothetical protein